MMCNCSQSSQYTTPASYNLLFYLFCGVLLHCNEKVLLCFLLKREAAAMREGKKCLPCSFDLTLQKLHVSCERLTSTKKIR